MSDLDNKIDICVSKLYEGYGIILKHAQVMFAVQILIILTRLLQVDNSLAVHEEPLVSFAAVSIVWICLFVY